MSTNRAEAFSCPYCEPAPELTFLSTPIVLGVWDKRPVVPGHALLILRRHGVDLEHATPVERLALLDAVDPALALMRKRFAIRGFNLALDSGTTAGQESQHLHLHLIPRASDAGRFVAEGSRAAFSWLLGAESAVADAEYSADELHKARLITGGLVDPFLTHLVRELRRATRVDIAVAFTLRGGIDGLRAELVDFLTRGGTLRFLTGDYLDATDPVALLDIVALEGPTPGQVHRRIFQTSNAAPDGKTALAFHPKTYVFYVDKGTGTAFVGSSNLSRSALQTGIEWNYRVVSGRDRIGFTEVQVGFEALFSHPATCPLTGEWVAAYQGRRKVDAGRAMPGAMAAGDLPEAAPEPSPSVPEPHVIQREALAALARAREEGAKAGLVVLATGLGKTWLSAFDSVNFARVLFVAHREEILNQALDTYRRIRPNDYLGHYIGADRHPNAKVLFASVQTLSRQQHLTGFAAGHFDYIVIDEFHHAAAATYRRLIRHFQPKFLLGLTATPERSDGADLLDLCDGRLIYRCDLADGIRNELLCPFHYFGVPDEVNYDNIPWRSTKFDEEELTSAVATQSRAKNALEQLDRRGGKRTLAFCVSQRHANFMADFFAQNGKRAVAVHAGPSSAPRAESLARLGRGELDIVCAVDMFNEGVDLPELDTVLMLRPSESKILWLQQFGRGLRRANDNKVLKVVDYIGNHRVFLLKPRTLFNLPAGDVAVYNLLERLDAGTMDLPPGCEVTYDLEAKNILRDLLRVARQPAEALTQYIRDFNDLHAVRPTALETYREGYNPRAARANYGSWLGLLSTAGHLAPEETQALDATRAFLSQLEVTPMSRCFKMAVLLAMLDDDKFPGEISLDDLVRRVRAIAEHHDAMRTDFGDAMANDATLGRCLETNPIDAWVTGSGMGGVSYFRFEERTFRALINLPSALRAPFQALAREIVEWRLAEYFDRGEATSEGEWVLKVSHADGKPIIFLPDAAHGRSDLPDGWSPILAAGEPLEANFVKIAINVVRKPGSADNVLPALLRGWFGPDAGAPGTRHQLRLKRTEDAWRLDPVGSGVQVPILWKSYSREQIAPLFGLPFSGSFRREGFVLQGNQIFLMVTLDKSDHPAEQKYEDRFVSATEFHWQSQNRTTQRSKHGGSIREHAKLGITVHLFVRPTTRRADRKACPFIYCGPVDFVTWSGEKPISVTWRLRDAVPERLHADFSVAGA